MRKLHSANQKDANGPNSKGKFESSIKQNSPKFYKNISINPRVNSQNQKDSRKIKKQEVYQESKLFSSGQSPQLRNILKFQPKTDVAKQLLDQIKKLNPNDTIAIKKTIVNFLCKYRENMKKGILSKSSLNERISKLHIEDSKELLLFCPVKKISGETQMPLNLESNTFLEILNEISSGHLMKYWKLLQQRKL